MRFGWEVEEKYFEEEGHNFDMQVTFKIMNEEFGDKYLSGGLELV